MIKNIIKGDRVFPLRNPHKRKIKCYLPGVEGFLVLCPYSFTNEHHEDKVATWELFIYPLTPEIPTIQDFVGK